MHLLFQLARRLGIGVPVILTAALACAPGADRIDAQITSQQRKVSTSDSSLAQEKVRLKTMQDSLEVRIARSVAVGLPETQARAIENTLLKAQKAVVDAEAVNLKTQQEYLALLKKRLAIPDRE